MADFIHTQEWLNQGDVVVVECDHQCNVRITDDANFDRFRKGMSHRYYGGFYRVLPARIAVPNSGRWNITVDLGGGRANVKYAINYIRENAYAPA